MRISKQHDERDCGAACLSMVAMHYGLTQPLSKYRELVKTDKSGTNLQGIVDGAAKIGLYAEALSGDIKDLMNGLSDGNFSFPFIAHIETEDALWHFVVVFGIKNNMFIVADPAKGKLKYSFNQFKELWTGYIVTFSKTESFVKGNFQKGGFTKFFKLLKGQYTKLVSVLIMSIVISFIGIVGAFVFQTVIDNFEQSGLRTELHNESCPDEQHTHEESTPVQSNILTYLMNFIFNNANNFNLIFVMVILLYILQGFIQLARGYLMALVSKKIDIDLMLSYFNHIIDIPVSSISTRKTGEYLSRFSDATAIRDAVSGATVILMFDSLMVVAAGIILYLQNNLLFMISVIIISIYVVIVLCYRKPIENINRHMMENNARVQSYLKETIDGIETIKSNNSENLVKEKANHKFTRMIDSVFIGNILSISQDTLSDLAELIGTVIILWIGFKLVLSGSITIGALITFYVLLSYFTSPIKRVIELQPMIQTAIVAADRLNDILLLETESDINNNNIKIDSVNEISFKNVDFRYGNRELTLKNISLGISRGEKVAIIGSSGCGKTTLVKLLMRFYQPESGSIEIDGKNIENISLSNLRSNIAYVDQNSFLFSDTIKNNLKISNSNITDEEIENACKLSRAYEFIENMPMKMETYLDENGNNLSGGQKQRLVIARALLKKPKILILDEATSNLDTITEEGIKSTIFNMNQEITLIIIAHRLSTIQNCDKIIVMENGEIIEAGTHSQLLDAKGLYSDFWLRQNK